MYRSWGQCKIQRRVFGLSVRWMVRVTFHSPCSWINSSLLANTSKPICFGQNKPARHGLFFFPLFFSSVGKEKVYIQLKEKKARTKLCLLCVCSQSSRCLELSAQPSHSFPHQCAIVFIALHSPRIFFHLFCCSSILTSASSQMETIRLPLPAWMMEVQVKRKKKQILCCWWKLFRHSCFVLQDRCWEQGSALIRMCRDCACIFKA